MANGFAPTLLRSLRDLAAQNYPGTKITPPGFLKMLLEYSSIQARLTNPEGHKKTVSVKYKQRVSPSDVATNDNCDIDLVPAYLESSLTAVNTVKFGFHIPLATVSQYMEEASRPVNVNGVSVINEIADQIQHTANAMLGKVDKVLLDSIDWGKNVVYGDDAVHDLNFPLDSTDFDLNSGFPKLMNDAFENEFAGKLLIVGSGKFNALQLSKMAAAYNAINPGQFDGYQFYPDLWAKNSTSWGTDDIGVFAPGAIHFVDVEKYVGFQAGKIGTSTFFQITLDVNGTPMLFDAQLREIDCPTVIPDIYGASTTFGVGYALYLRKTYGLFQLPSNSFATSDRCAGVNGAIHYNVTNNA